MDRGVAAIASASAADRTARIPVARQRSASGIWVVQITMCPGAECGQLAAEQARSAPVLEAATAQVF
jgi:hypothetical protein